MKSQTISDAERRDWTWSEIDSDPRLERARSEMLVTFVIYAVYVAVMFVVMYTLSADGAGTASYLFGLPAYLAAVCLIAVGSVVATSAVAWIYFREDCLEDGSGHAGN